MLRRGSALILSIAEGLISNVQFLKMRKEYSQRKRFERPKDEFESKLLDLARVTRVTAGGKRLRFRAVVIIGNKQGKVGVGVSKGLDVSQSIEKAVRLAKKNLVVVPMKEDTIPHEVYAKFGASKVILKPQRKGRGLVAGGVVRVICTLAGIKNISSKVLGRTRNKLNNAQATISALKKLKIINNPYRKGVGETIRLPRVGKQAFAKGENVRNRG